MDALVIAQEHADITLDSIEGVLSVDTALHVTYLNVAAERMTRLTWNCGGRPHGSISAGRWDDAREAANPLEVAVERGGEVPSRRGADSSGRA
jgi:hypothetical protein